MAFLPKRFGLPGGERRGILKTLRKIAAEKTPLRLELENTDIHFLTVLQIRREMVVFAKPRDLRKQFKTGSMVRFTLPHDRKLALRFRVKIPHFRLMRGGPVILCEIPQQFADPPQRAHDRFSTSRFKNISLVLPGPQKNLRIVDVSAEGCKVYHGGLEDLDWVEVGERINTAHIEILNRVKLELEMVIPRSVELKTIGFEFRLSGRKASREKFAIFLGALEKAELTRLHRQTF